MLERRLDRFVMTRNIDNEAEANRFFCDDPRYTPTYSTEKNYLTNVV